MQIRNIESIAKGHVSDAPIVHDVLDIFQRLYGCKPYRIPGLPEANEPNPYQMGQRQRRQRTQTGSSLYGGQDLIGREVFLPVTISVYDREKGEINYEFPYSLLGMRRSKIVVETPMVERGGSVNEQIGLESWRISLKGFLIDPLNEFPDDQLDLLNRLFLTNEPVRLKCALSDIFLKEDDHVVIKELDIPAKAKVIGVRDFELTMVGAPVFDFAEQQPLISESFGPLSRPGGSQTA